MARPRTGEAAGLLFPTVFGRSPQTHAWRASFPPGAAPERQFFEIRKSELSRYLNLCQSIADLDVLADPVRRENSKLRGINGRRGTDSVPCHHKFSKT